jgi:hypothetical protein
VQVQQAATQQREGVLRGAGVSRLRAQALDDTHCPRLDAGGKHEEADIELVAAAHKR